MWRVQLVSSTDETVAVKPVQLQATNHQFDLPEVLEILRPSGRLNVGSLKARLWDGKYCHRATDKEIFQQERNSVCCAAHSINTYR